MGISAIILSTLAVGEVVGFFVLRKQGKCITKLEKKTGIKKN